MKYFSSIAEIKKLFHSKMFCNSKKDTIFALAIRKWLCLIGEMAERSNAAVLKTVDCNRSGGSNPSFSANENRKVL